MWYVSKSPTKQKNMELSCFWWSNSKVATNSPTFESKRGLFFFCKILCKMFDATYPRVGTVRSLFKIYGLRDSSCGLRSWVKKHISNYKLFKIQFLYIKIKQVCNIAVFFGEYRQCGVDSWSIVTNVQYLGHNIWRKSCPHRCMNKFNPSWSCRNFLHAAGMHAG